MTDEAKALVDRYSVCAGDKPYTNGIRDLAEMPHVSEQLGNVFRDCAHIIDAQNDRIETLETQLESANEALRERLDICETQAREIARLRRDKQTLMIFAQSIQEWRQSADSYDEECDHPQRDYCEDVELMEKAAGYALRRIAERAARGEQ